MRLGHGPRGATHQMLVLVRLDPEVRRVVGHVGEHGHERHAGQRGADRFAQRPVEVGDQRDHQIGLAAQPMLLQLLQQCVVAEPDHALQQLELLRQPQRPASGQALVVEVLGRHAGDLAEPARWVEHLGEIHEPHIPRPSLFEDHRLQRLRCGTVPATGVEVDEVDRFAHAQATGSVLLYSALPTRSFRVTVIARDFGSMSTWPKNCKPAVGAVFWTSGPFW